jgi:hypothetical protein
MGGTELERSTMHKVRLHFVPLLFTCFVVAFLDRVNVGFAALTMNKDIVMWHNTVTSSGTLPARHAAGATVYDENAVPSLWTLALVEFVHST